jgi:hypothetical protein
VEDDEPAEEGRAAHPINITNAGGCILAHSMGECLAGRLLAVVSWQWGPTMWVWECGLSRRGWCMA